MKHLFTTTLAALALAVTTTAFAEPEVRKAIPVHRGEKPTLPAEPQVRRAIPVEPGPVASEMEQAAEATWAREEGGDLITAAPTEAAAASVAIEKPAPATRDNGSSKSGAGGAFLFWTAYFFPAIVAFVRRHHNAGAVLVLNLFLAWTIFGWILALIWASTNPTVVRVKA